MDADDDTVADADGEAVADADDNTVAVVVDVDAGGKVREGRERCFLPYRTSSTKDGSIAPCAAKTTR